MKLGVAIGAKQAYHNAGKGDAVLVATVKLRVAGMHCGHCQSKVEGALTATAGVYSAVVDLQAGEAEVDFEDDRVTTGQLLAAVQRAGYGARLAG